MQVQSSGNKAAQGVFPHQHKLTQKISHSKNTEVETGNEQIFQTNVNVQNIVLSKTARK